MRVNVVNPTFVHYFSLSDSFMPGVGPQPGV